MAMVFLGKGVIIVFDKNKSVRFTHFMVRSFYFVIAAVALFSIISKGFSTHPYYFIPLYVTLPVGVGALICLDELLCNIRKNIVFDKSNVKFLSSLSICCFVAAAIAMISFIIFIILNWNDDFWFLILLYIIFPIMSIGEIFVGLIVRVVKNAFGKAIEIKDENDLTI